MVDHVDIVRIKRTLDPESFVPAFDEEPVWSGPCKVQTYEPDAVEVDVAGKFIARQEDRLHVPVTAGPFEVGDVARVRGYDRPYRIDGLLHKTYQTSQRLKVTMIINSEVGDG